MRKGEFFMFGNYYLFARLAWITMSRLIQTGTRTNGLCRCTYCLARNVESKVSWVIHSPDGSKTIGCLQVRMCLKDSQPYHHCRHHRCRRCRRRHHHCSAAGCFRVTERSLRMSECCIIVQWTFVKANLEF